MIKITVALVTISVIVFTGLFIRELFFDHSDKPPAPPPPYFVENPKNEYIIVKKGNIYYIPFTLNGVQVFAPVGKSAYDLAPFVNKTAILKVDYPKTPQEYPNYLTKYQCIKNVCDSIYPNEKYPSYILSVNVLNIKQF